MKRMLQSLDVFVFFTLSHVIRPYVNPTVDIASKSDLLTKNVASQFVSGRL